MLGQLRQLGGMRRGKAQFLRRKSTFQSKLLREEDNRIKHLCRKNICKSVAIMFSIHTVTFKIEKFSKYNYGSGNTQIGVIVL